MNALQIIPPKHAVKIRRSAPVFRASDAILLLLILVGGMSMSQGEEGVASEPGAAVVVKDSRDEVGGSDSSPVVTQSVVPSAAATMEDSSSGGSEGRASASAQAIALPATPTSAGVKNDPKVVGEAGKTAAVEAKSNTAASAAIKDSASVVSKNNLAPKPGAARVRKTAPNALAARSAETARRAHQPRGKVDYRSWTSADGGPVWVGPPPIIYGPSPVAKAPYVVDPADGMESQDRMPLAAKTGIWTRVVDAPGAVLNGGKQALYGIFDWVW